MTNPVNGPVLVALLLTIAALVVLLALCWQGWTTERSMHAATRYDLGAAWSAYDALRVEHEDLLFSLSTTDDWPPAVREWTEAAARDLHPVGKGLRVVGGGE